MSHAGDINSWVKNNVIFDEALSDKELEEWQDFFKEIAKDHNGNGDFPFKDGRLEIKQPLPSENFYFWLKRAMQRDHAQAAVYDSSSDQLIGRGIYWRQDKEMKEDISEALLPLTSHGKHPALLLDRDGIINVDGGYINKIEDVSFVEGIENIIAFANKRNIKVIVVTNQSGIGRGYYTEKDVLTLHQWMGAELLKKGAKVDAWYYSPYHPDATEERYKKASYTRKPLPGMALMAAADHSLCLENSAMVGDKVSDILAHVDITTFLLQGNYPLGNYSKTYNHLNDILDELTRFYLRR